MVLTDSKFKVLGTRIMIKVDEPKAGVLDSSSMNVAKEVGEVIGVGDGAADLYHIKVGDRVMFKSWAVDIITNDGEKYYFIDMATGGVCAVF
jgi:co-chaperonin GroES (HSP10)